MEGVRRSQMKVPDEGARRSQQRRGAVLHALDDLAVLGIRAVHEDRADRAEAGDDRLGLKVHHVEDDVVRAACKELRVVEDLPQPADDGPAVALEVVVALEVTEDVDDLRAIGRTQKHSEANGRRIEKDVAEAAVHLLAHLRMVRVGVDERNRPGEIRRRRAKPRKARRGHLHAIGSHRKPSEAIRTNQKPSAGAPSKPFEEARSEGAPVSPAGAGRRAGPRSQSTSACTL